MNWLFIKGLARGQVHWGRQPEVFTRGVPDARVSFLDLPGVGVAVSHPAPTSVAQIVANLHARFLDLKTNHTGPWSLLGISLGGMIAMEWGTKHPGDFERSVVIVSSGANVSAPWKRLLPSTLPSYLRALLTNDIHLREKISLETVTNRHENLDRWAQEWLALAPDCPLPVAATLKQLLAASLWCAPKRLVIPTLFLGTKGDQMVHPSCTPRLAARFSAPLVMHADAGHEIPLDDPEWIASQVALWLAQASPT